MFCYCEFTWRGLRMEIRDAYEKIVRESLQHIACIDDDFVEPYMSIGESDKNKLKFSQDMYQNLKCKCDGHVELQKYYGGIEESILEKCMMNKDLLVLDWELTGSNDEPVLQIISKAVNLQVPFICIYTNRQDTKNIYPIICDYFSGYTKLTVEEACDKWMDVGVLEDEFKSDVKDLFAGSDEKLRQMIKKLNLEEENKRALENLDYDKKEGWYPLWLKWNHAILPDMPLHKARNLSNEAVIIDGKIIVCLSKAGPGAGESVHIDELIPAIASHITNVPNSVFDIVWLNYTNSLRKVLQARSNLFNNIDASALGWFAKGLLDEGIEIFDDFMKQLYQDEIMDRLDGQKVGLPECVINDIKKEYCKVLPNSCLPQLMELNEKISVNHFYSNLRHKLDFGDVFVVDQEQQETFWLCVTAKCECLRESKINNNYLFIRGERIDNQLTALKNAESKFYSFVKYKDEIVAIKWITKLGSVYIKSEDNIIGGIGGIIIGNYQGNTLNYTYVCNLKENYAQRMANEAFSEGNKVGITLAQIRK